MDTEIKITAPVLDKSIIQKAAQEAATKAALREIEDYYCGFDSPYRKQLREYLQENAPSTRLELPEFSEMLSKSLSAEIENIVNKKCVISTQLTRRLRSKPRSVPYHSLCSQV